jgi:hypothetical protein
MNNFQQQFICALQEVKFLMERAFVEVDGLPNPGSDLDQLGLKDGVSIIEEYLDHREIALALEHLIYMIISGCLPISLITFNFIKQAGQDLRVDTKLIKEVINKDT